MKKLNRIGNEARDGYITKSVDFNQFPKVVGSIKDFRLTVGKLWPRGENDETVH